MADPMALDTLIVEQSPDTLICSDITGAIIRWNRTAEAMFGYRAHPAAPVVHPTPRPQ